MITLSEFKQKMSVITSESEDGIEAMFFAMSWHEVRDGTAQARLLFDQKNVVNIGLFGPDDELHGEVIDKSDFVSIHYNDLKRAVLLGKVFVTHADPIKLVHVYWADLEDRLNRLDTYDSLSALRQMKEENEKVYD